MGTKSIGRKEVCSRLQDKGVPFRFYHGDSDVSKRFRDLADPGKWWAQLGAIVHTTVVGRGVDLPGPPTLKVSRVFVTMDRLGCDFGDLFQAMLRARKVQNPTIEVLLVRTMAPEQRAQLVREGKRKPIVRPTFEQSLKRERGRRGYALRAAERQARAAGGDRSSTPASEALLRVMAHSDLNRKMQETDPVYAFKRYADYYDMPIETMPPSVAQAAADGALQLDEDDAFDVNTSPEEKWAIVVRTIRERGELGFFNDQCWGIATDEKQKATGEDALTTLQLWLVKAYHPLKNLGELPEQQQPAGDEGGGDEGGEVDDPAAELLFTLLGNGTDCQDQTPALELQAHCLIRTPVEQMQQDNADQLESSMIGKPRNHEHCKYGLGQKMGVVERFAKLVLRGGYRHVRQVFDPDGGGIVANANAELVAAANRQKLKQMTQEDEQLLRQLQQIAEQFKVTGKQSTIIEVLKGVGKAMGLKLGYKHEQPRQPDGTRHMLVRADPGLRFESVLPKVVDKWLIWSTALGAKVSVADWPRAHAEQQLQQAWDAAAADDHDYGNLFSAPLQPADGTIGGNVRVELLDDRALQHELSRLTAQYNGSVWMDSVLKLTRAAWDVGQRAAYARHLRSSSALESAKAINREAEPPDERGVRKLQVIYGKNSLGLGRRTASAPSMQHCQKELRRALCGERYHDVDMVSCHPTLMLQVVRKMVASHAIQWSGSLNKLAEYATLNANGEPTGRLPMLLRIAKYFGIDESVAKDVAKTLVLRVLNGGSVEAWCREMDIGSDACEGPIDEQADLRDLEDVARLVREAFFAMLERDARAALQERVGAMLQDRHERRVHDAQRNSETPPQPPGFAARDRTMFSHIMFDLEDRVLDCIDRKLGELGWTVASLIYDGVRRRHPTAPTSRLRPRLLPTPALSHATSSARARSCTLSTATTLS